MQHDDNLTRERPTFVTHLECSATGEHYAADQVHNLSRAGKPLLVRYNLAGVRDALTREALAARPPDFWRYRELLPVRKAEDVVSLGEAITPLVSLPKIAARLGAGEILVKDEGRLPTGSFKARGLALAVSMAKALGIRHMAMPELLLLPTQAAPAYARPSSVRKILLRSISARLHFKVPPSTASMA